MLIWQETTSNMNKFALVGKDIAHSRSPEMYRKLISPAVHYDLLDYKNESDIPKASELLSKYDGINITSPYKKHFLSEVELTDSAKNVGAINCLKKGKDKIWGENTDYLAIVDILKDFQTKYGQLEIVILGDGVMSVVAQQALKNLQLSFQLLSRKLTKDFNQLNLNDYFHEKNGRPLVINTCAREFVFNGNLPITALFWDFNYNFPPHSSQLPAKTHLYTDGLEMLERQAFYAVAFWSDRKFS